MATYTYNFQLQISYDEGTQIYTVVSGGPPTNNPTEQITDNDLGSEQFTENETVTFPGATETYLGIISLFGEAFLLTTGSTSTSFEAFCFVDDPASFDVDGLTFSEVDIDTSPFTACFAAGTPIATPDGERAVETLRAGDVVLTADGRAVPVKWVGRQTVHKLFTADHQFRPVRLRSGSLAENRPRVDLVVTADHALLLDDMLVQAGALVNGATIERVPSAELAERVTYYHLETEGHEVVLAAGVPAETFVDSVTRRRFDNYAEYEALHGDTGATIAEIAAPRIKSARQLPAALRERLAARTMTVGSGGCLAA